MNIKIKLIAERLIRRVLQRLMSYKHRPGISGAGFVLPTVTMVLLVVILLTVAISLRSFNRVEDARNVRVNQAVLSAAAPALDRARAKLEELLVTNPPTTDTPTDDALYLELTTTVGGDKYTFGDEQRLQVAYKIQGSSIEEGGEDGDISTIEDNEIVRTVWRFPVDTDNNGSFDSFTIYSIFFLTPQRNDDGSFAWARTPLDARTPPMESGTAAGNPECEAIAGTSSILVGDSGWYKSDSQLKKSFFTYVATVPITDLSEVGNYNSDTGNSFTFETFRGTTGFSALEYQQDWSRVPLTNNAVVYEDDLEIAPGPDFRLNGRIQANSNLIISSTDNNDIDLYLVSSPNSCFYSDEENSKIFVGGNIVNGLVERDGEATDVQVHLQQGTTVIDSGANARISGTHESVSDEARLAAYNSQATQRRINWLVNAQIAAFPDTDSPGNDGYGFAEQDDDEANDDPSDDDTIQADPKDVIDDIRESTQKEQARRNALESYFKKVVRKVPFSDIDEGEPDDTVTLGADDNPTGTIIAGAGDDLRPDIDSWVLPTGGDIDTASGSTTGLNLNLAELIATDPEIVEANDGKQNFVGDRVFAGNNLPQEVWNGESLEGNFEQKVDGTTQWSDAAGGDSGQLRTRQPQVVSIPDVGSIERDGFWEDAAATEPEAALDGEGGLRVITGAGVYERINSFLPPPPDTPGEFEVVWPDTMPMSPVEVDGSIVYDNATTNDWLPLTNLVAAPLDTTNYSAVTPTIDPNTAQYAKGDLRMRATAVYHYAQDFINDNDDSSQAPIACISSYYDPSTSRTARNVAGLADVSGLVNTPTYNFIPPITIDDNERKSNNGIVYGPPGTRPNAATYDSGTELFSGSGLLGLLADQANMVFPNGRFVNEKLRDALQKNDDDRSLSEQAAVDTTMCALGILGNTAVTLETAPSYIDDGAIKEVSFLDARQIKASDVDSDLENDPLNGTTNIDETFTIFDLTGGGEIANLTTDSNLSLEERQPLEIRATQLDLNVLRTAAFSPSTSVGPRRDGNEYLLPLSGIIYASRDDALPDRSDPSSTNNELEDSPFDYKLDPTRRPNAIMLINGQRVDRPVPGTMTIEEVTKEKGLTLVSNLPVYIQGDFNLHQNSTDTDIEEFEDTLADNWSDFYSRDDLDPNFACRAGDPRLSACTNGDQWRPVNILADALSLLSDAWRPGFRNEGDFDLRNNAGNLRYGGAGNPALIATGTELNSRRENGFFANNYATNGLSSGADFDGDDYTDNNYRSHQNNPRYSSYFTNFVTPVQRRVNQFPEYVMEVCPKLSVYACEPDDWVVGTIDPVTGIDTTHTVFSLFSSDASTANYTDEGMLDPGTDFANDALIVDLAVPDAISGDVNTLASGTTASSPDDAVQRFPRRIAFLRNEYGELELDEENRPIPIGVRNNTQIQAFPYGRTATPVLPRVDQNNVLLFRKTDDISDPTNISNATYANDQPLFYLAYNETNNTGTTPILPPTQEINGFSLTDDNNALDGDDAYGYSFCTDAGISQDYYAINEQKGITITDTSSCPTNAMDSIQNLRGELIGLAVDDTWDGISDITINGDTDDTDDNGIVVYEVSTISAGRTLTLEGDSSDIFVLKTDASTTNLTFPANFQLALSAVNPNNVFWVSNSGMTFNDPTTLAGNFLGSTTGTLTINPNTEILGGRFLGFASAPMASPAGVDIRAISNQGNPSLVPVLQIHEPDNNINLAGNATNNSAWMVRATDTTFNLVSAAGDTPSRPGQSNGGLQNLIRFQENWKSPNPERTINISGAFIQLGRSKYATAGQQQLRRADIGDDSALFEYPQRYSGAAGGILGFQAPPNRQWGFDVGLLSQSPDLFAQKFSLPSSDNKPDEYYREIGRDDPWITALLCAEDLSGNDVTSRSGVDCSDYDD